jgi:hypothetical protein
MAKREFPRTLFKKADRDDDTAKKWGKWKTGSPKQGGAYHTLVVENQTEFDAALEMGYIDDFETALFGEQPVEETVVDEEF